MPETPVRDINGRELMTGDLIRVPHFTARNRRKIWMHKLIVEFDGFQMAVDVCDIQRKRSLETAHRCPVGVLRGFEIIDGGTVDDDNLWWERRRVT